MNEQLENTIEEKLAHVLAEIYLRIPWRKIGTKSAHKFFVDRIRASANSMNFKQFLDTFTLKVNVEFVKLNTNDLNFLYAHDSFVMSLLRKESTYLANYSLEIVNELKNN